MFSTASMPGLGTAGFFLSSQSRFRREFDKRARERSLGVWASLHRWLLAIGILGVTDFMQPVASGTGPGMKRSEILPDDWRRLFSHFAWFQLFKRNIYDCIFSRVRQKRRISFDLAGRASIKQVFLHAARKVHSSCDPSPEHNFLKTHAVSRIRR